MYKLGTIEFSFLTIQTNIKLIYDWLTLRMTTDNDG